MRIPIIKLPFTQDDVDAIAEKVKKIFASGNMVMGPYTAEFESKFATMNGSRHAIAVANGTSALEVILKALDVRGSTVIVPTNTFVATAFAAIQSGAKVEFADCSPDTFCLDPADLKRRLHKGVKAVMLVHIGGIVTDKILEIAAICKEAGVHLVEDCAHAHFSEFDGRMAGTFGIAAGFSFFPTKVLVSGEGGIVTTDSDELAEKMKKIRNHGKDPARGGAITELATNYRLSEIHSMIAAHQLDRADWIIGRRRSISAYYDKALANVPGLKPLALHPKFKSSYYKYLLMLDPKIDRAEFKKRLKEQYTIDMTGEVYAGLVHDEPYFKEHGYGHLDSQRDFPGAYYVSRNHVCPPNYPLLTDEEAAYVADSMKKVVSSL